MTLCLLCIVISNVWSIVEHTVKLWKDIDCLGNWVRQYAGQLKSRLLEGTVLRVNFKSIKYLDVTFIKNLKWPPECLCQIFLCLIV